MRQTLEDVNKLVKEEGEDLYSENALEMSSMNAKERRAYKKELRNKRLQAMDGNADDKFKMVNIYPNMVIVAGADAASAYKSVNCSTK